jgi:hypothetical protein
MRLDKVLGVGRMLGMKAPETLSAEMGFRSGGH